MIPASQQHYLFQFLSQDLYLLPERAIFWKNEHTLIIADVHLGKVSHFRKESIAIPSNLADKDLHVLDSLLKYYPVHQVIFLGDLFHSTHNRACQTFCEWLNQYPQIDFQLVKGNHDILPANFYQDNGVRVHTTHLVIPPFIFSHIPLEEKNPLYNLAGHIHPAVQLWGKGRQKLVLPCFYFQKKFGILPAFGAFTGKGVVSVTDESRIFVIGNNQVIPALMNMQG